LTSTERGNLVFTGGVPSIQSSNFTQDWTLDGLGNFSEFNDDGSVQTREVNTANEIQTINSAQTVHYDRAGNMISDGTLKYQYDAWNRQTDITLTNDTFVVSYLYDGLGRRISKYFQIVGPDVSQPQYYYNTNWQLIDERLVAPSGRIDGCDQYVWSLTYIDTPIVRFHSGSTYLGGEDGNIIYYVADANHNITALVNASGAVVERYYYDAYGKATICNTIWQPLHNAGLTPPSIRLNDGGWSAYGNEILYCGYFYDSETSQNASVTIGASGNYYARRRYYSVAIAAWFTRDPIGYNGGINLYEYVGDDPLIATDSSGKDPNPTKPRPPGDTTGMTPQGGFDVEFRPVPVPDPAQQATLGGTSSPGYVIKYNPAANACVGGQIVLVQAIDHGGKYLGNGVSEKLPKFDGDIGKNGEWPVYDPNHPGIIRDRPYEAGLWSHNWYNTVCAVCVHNNPYSQQILGCVNLVWNDDLINPSLSIITPSGKKPIILNSPVAKFPAAIPGKTWCKAEKNYGGER
jgi:RHS repeat-associated protein